MAGRLLIYGATGYTGKLFAAHAAERGLAPIAAGRSAARVKAIAAQHGSRSERHALPHTSDSRDPITSP